MKKMAGGTLLALSFFMLTGCSNNEDLVEKQQEEIGSLQLEVTALEKSIDDQEKTIKSQQAQLNSSEEEFTFVNDLTVQEHNAYGRFLKTKSTVHLANFTPEKILLLYLHSAVIDDVETLYALIYDNGTLPEELETFREQYYTGELSNYNKAFAMDNRYYDTVAVREENRSDEEVGVEMSVSLGTSTHVTIFSLKKDSGIWKMDVLHLGDAM